MNQSIYQTKEFKKQCHDMAIGEAKIREVFENSKYLVTASHHMVNKLLKEYKRVDINKAKNNKYYGIFSASDFGLKNIDELIEAWKMAQKVLSIYGLKVKIEKKYYDLDQISICYPEWIDFSVS